jgi:hypothetical protein
MRLTQSPNDLAAANDPSRTHEEQQDIVPPWLVERLQTIFAELEGETLPEDFVILFRHLNGAEHP